MLCPICYQSCTQKINYRGVPLGPSCEYINLPQAYHRFVFFSQNNFAITIRYSLPNQNKENSIILGVIFDVDLDESVLLINDTRIKVMPFEPCEALDVINKYLKLSVML